MPVSMQRRVQVRRNINRRCELVAQGIAELFRAAQADYRGFRPRQLLFEINDHHLSRKIQGRILRPQAYITNFRG